MELPRPFPFTVSWSSLTAGLQPREIADRARAVPQEFSTALTVAPPMDVPVFEAPATASSGRWEMVVPKMVRTGRGTFERVDTPPAQSVADDRLPAPLPAPMFANYTREPLFSKALSLIGRRTRALLPAPSVVADDTAERIAAREQWLSRITKSLRNRPAEKGGRK